MSKEKSETTQALAAATERRTVGKLVGMAQARLDAITGELLEHHAAIARLEGRRDELAILLRHWSESS